MTKKQLALEVIDRLKKYKVDIDEMLEIIGKNNIGVIGYTSHMEKLGTNNSDIDVYVICEQLPKDHKFKVCGKYLVNNLIMNGR